MSSCQGRCVAALFAAASMCAGVLYAAPRPFVPVFFGAKTGEMEPFAELQVFTDAIPTYAIAGLQKPRLRPFTKHDEYPKKYVQRIPEKARRKITGAPGVTPNTAGPL